MLLLDTLGGSFAPHSPSLSRTTYPPSPSSWGFAGRSPIRFAALPSPEESAQALTDFMAKAHEEKLRAVTEVEQKYRAEIDELKEKLELYEADATKSTAGVAASKNSYEFPATNKGLSDKVRAYHKFISEYIVNAQIEKVKAVQAAERKLKEKYEASA